MVTIIMLAAVLLIQADSSAVASMKPSTSRPGESPTSCTVCSARRRCNCHFSMASAIRKPPMNR
jgi:hypothetical protein